MIPDRKYPHLVVQPPDPHEPGSRGTHRRSSPPLKKDRRTREAVRDQYHHHHRVGVSIRGRCDPPLRVSLVMKEQQPLRAMASHHASPLSRFPASRFGGSLSTHTFCTKNTTRKRKPQKDRGTRERNSRGCKNMKESMDRQRIRRKKT